MKNKLIIILNIIFILFLVPITTNAEEVINDDNYYDYTDYNSSYDYIINGYDINIIVNENNVLEITENISTYFYVNKHGIYRKLPLKNEIERLDGTKSNNRVHISDIYVNNEFTTYKENGYEVIKIGSADYTVTGQNNYRITYSYNLGKDTGKEYDELYFNLIGDEWDTVISNVTFTITMPKEFDESKLGFSNGVVGSTTNDVTYTVNGNVITGQLNNTLEPGEALTIRLELPEGYFVGAKLPISPLIYLLYIIPISSLLIAILIWYKYGKDNKVIETVEFYPPEGFNSLEVGFLYKGEADNEDVTSLLIYLANNGYIRIIEKNPNSLRTTFIIEKLKDYDGDSESEKMFFNGLFKNKDRVTRADLYNKFYKTTNSILKDINTKENKEKIFEKQAGIMKKIIIVLLYITLILTLAIPSYESGSIEAAIVSVILVFFYTPFFAVGLKIKGKSKLFVLGFVTFHASCFFMALPVPAVINSDTLYLYGFLLGLICTIGIGIIIKIMPKRTKYGNEMLGKINGFRNFLKNVEKEGLERRVLENPSYFYDILPYTYVLGISEKWIEKFETINLQAPDWYSGEGSFNHHSFGKFISRTMDTAQTSMASSPSSSSSGGSSGGGSSGGGSGGGGGGSW